jgi:hypothetical protein
MFVFIFVDAKVEDGGRKMEGNSRRSTVDPLRANFALNLARRIRDTHSRISPTRALRSGVAFPA